ncbi:putative iron-regulated protein [Jannaschia seosinensis]|uniref:Putative iron-regulated protein n=1 Tax=Jannaschia seosinensis TaxID=313367 RepID=A0A0M7B9S4_9RHOB|nr:ChaN family lipoprotein [Jannaschia seosinensis]CUH27655.1 putative iron-regulated protein [Jannaschia seosinensis]
MILRALAIFATIGPAAAQNLPPADVYVIGEIHGNPAHHATQARLVAHIAPRALVFEQLSGAQADRISPDARRNAATLGPLLDWDESGWPDIALYAPIMAAADAPILGAAGEAGDLSAYDLDTALPAAEQQEREALQAAAHCDALPTDLLPDFVARQRAIDAQFAARTLDALDRYGAPVVLITGNGHARTDWGVPAAIARVRPDLRVVAIVQGEGEPTVPGDIVLQADAPPRDDPCAAFR